MGRFERNKLSAEFLPMYLSINQIIIISRNTEAFSMVGLPIRGVKLQSIKMMKTTLIQIYISEYIYIGYIYLNIYRIYISEYMCVCVCVCVCVYPPGAEDWIE